MLPYHLLDYHSHFHCMALGICCVYFMDSITGNKMCNVMCVCVWMEKNKGCCCCCQLFFCPSCIVHARYGLCYYCYHMYMICMHCPRKLLTIYIFFLLGTLFAIFHNKQITQPFEGLCRCNASLNNFLERLVIWPRECGHSIMNCSRSCPRP